MAKQKTKKMKHDDEFEDKKLVKKMVKEECQKPMKDDKPAKEKSYKDEKPAKKGKKK